MKNRKWVVVVLSIFISLSVFLFPTWQSEFGKASWGCFIGTMMVRPLFELLWKYKIPGIVLRELMMWRRELGILVGVFGLAHGAGVLLLYGKEWSDLFTSAMWDFRTLWGWGMLAMALLLPPLATSNMWSMKQFAKWWKPLQRVSYAAFVATGIHVFLTTNDLLPLLIVGAWGGLWLLTFFKKFRR